jgi:hypothetical protein
MVILVEIYPTATLLLLPKNFKLRQLLEASRSTTILTAEPPIGLDVCLLLETDIATCVGFIAVTGVLGVPLTVTDVLAVLLK